MLRRANKSRRDHAKRRSQAYDHRRRYPVVDWSEPTNRAHELDCLGQAVSKVVGQRFPEPFEGHTPTGFRRPFGNT
jgi:hypothetical protein